RAITVVAWGASWANSRGACSSPDIWAKCQKEGPGSPWALKSGRPTQLLSALLDVVTHELFGVLFEHFVDLVEQVVEISLQLVALGRVYRHVLRSLARALSALFLYPLL